jgi:hypothetical protein
LRTGSWLLHNFATTGVGSAEIVDNEPSQPKDGTWDELYGRKGIEQDGKYDGNDKGPNEHSRLLEDLLCQETVGRGRPKALCYEDMTLMFMPHHETKNVLAMAAKFIHHKGANNNSIRE